MAEGKKTVVIYTDWVVTFKALDDATAGRLIKHVFAYVNDENPQTDDPIINVVFPQMRHALKQDLKRWEEKCERNRENANKRWHPKQPKTTKGMQSHATASNGMRANAKHADNDNDNDINKKSKPKKVTNVPPPTKEEFMLYLRDDYLKTQPARYQEVRQHMITTFDLWKENGWKDGNDKPIKNWKVKAISQLRYVKPKKR